MDSSQNDDPTHPMVHLVTEAALSPVTVKEWQAATGIKNNDVFMHWAYMSLRLDFVDHDREPKHWRATGKHRNYNTSPKDQGTTK